MIRQEEFFGRAQFEEFDGTFVMSAAIRVYCMSAQTARGSVQLPRVGLRKPGGPHHWVLNIGASSFDLRHQDGTALATLTPGSYAQANLLSQDNFGTWFVRTGIIGQATETLRRLNGRLVGGSTNPSFHDALDTEAGTWSGDIASPTGRTNAVGFGLRNRAFYVGDDPAGADSRVTEDFDGTAWSTRSSCPYPPVNACGATVDGVAIILSGSDAADVAEYQMDAWSSKSPVPLPRDRASAATVGKEIVLIPGRPEAVTGLRYRRDDDAFRSITPNPGDDRLDHSSFELGGRVFACGGSMGSTALDTCESYSPVTDSWVTEQPISGKRIRGTAFSANGRGYYAGGRNESLAIQGDVYEFSGSAWSVHSSLTLPASEIANHGVTI